MREKLRTTHLVDPSIQCGDKVKARPSVPFATRGWIQLFVSNSRNQNRLINPSKITSCAAKVVIVISKVKLLNANINITKITLYVKVCQKKLNFVGVSHPSLPPCFFAVTHNTQITACAANTHMPGPPQPT